MRCALCVETARKTGNPTKRTSWGIPMPMSMPRTITVSLAGRTDQFLDKALELDARTTFALAFVGLCRDERGDYVAGDHPLAESSEPDAARDQPREMQMMSAGRYFQSSTRNSWPKPEGRQGKPTAQLSLEQYPKKIRSPMLRQRLPARFPIGPALPVKLHDRYTCSFSRELQKARKRRSPVLRKQVKDLPLPIYADDSMAMQPEMVISISIRLWCWRVCQNPATRQPQIRRSGRISRGCQAWFKRLIS